MSKQQKHNINSLRYYYNNKERLDLKQKKYAEDNRNRANIYFKNNREKIKNKMKLYFQTSKGIFQNIKNSARKRKLILDFTVEEFVNWYKEQPQICHYCTRTLEQVLINSRGITRLSIDRVNNKLGYFINNIVLCCFLCNEIKHDYFTEEEMLEIGKVIYRKEVVYNDDGKKGALNEQVS